jgi:ribosomal protein L11 methyltransferase
MSADVQGVEKNEESGTGDGASSVVARLTAERADVEKMFAMLSETLDPEQTAFSLFETSSGRWTAAIHCRQAPNQTALRDLVTAAVGPQVAADLVFETITPQDWVAASLAGLTPVHAGRFLVHGSHDRSRVPMNRIGIEIEAALAFGTGHHGSTRGCLLMFDALLKAQRPRRPLDVGSGTGVLAIAAARTLRRHVLASDIDGQAVVVARANLRLNGVAPFIRLVRADGLTDFAFRPHAYDLVFANILLGPLQRLARPIARVLAPRGRVILAGLLPSHANAACAAYRTQGLVLERRLLVDGWVTLMLRRER